MTEVQQKLLDLLKEIDGICKENDIQYFLYGRTALEAVRKKEFQERTTSAVIAIKAQDCERFIRLVEKQNRQDRYLESMLNNKNYPRVALRYGDRNSLDFSTTDWGNYDNHGIRVIIEILRDVEPSKTKRLMNQGLEVGWEVLNNPKYYSKKKQTAYRVVKGLTLVMGKKRTAQWLFHRLVSSSPGNSSQVFIKKYWGARTRYPREWFKYTATVPMEDTAFSLPWIKENYLKTQFGARWNRRKIEETPVNPAVRLLDPNLPFAEYLQEINQGDVNQEEIWKLRKEFVKKNAKNVTLNGEIRKCWQNLFFVGDRYNLYEDYEKKKLYLNELYRGGNAGVMRKVLLPYERLMVQYNKHHLGLCFDPDVYKWMEYSMIRKGRGSVMKTTAKYIPKGHKDPIQLVDHLGNPIQKEEVTGMRLATEDDVKAILVYLRKDVGNCVYLYIDIAKYGLENPNMKVWFDTDDEGINLVVMKYYNSIQVYSRQETWNVEEVAELIRNEQVGMVSGQSWIIDKLYPICGENYNLEVGHVFELPQFRAFEDVVEIETGTVDDTLEIAELICSNESIGGYYEIENLANQLKERIETGIGRSLIIRKDGKMVGHIATYAEFNGIAVTAGLIAKDDETRIPYGTILESRLVLDLLNEKFRVFTFVTEKRRAKFLTLMGCEEIGRYGKMTLKE